MRLSLKIPHSAVRVTATREVAEEEPLSPQAMLFRQPQFNGHVIFILGFGKFLTAKKIKAGLEATLLRHPRFSSVQVADNSWRKKLVWVQTKVNVEDHIIFPNLGAYATSALIDPTVGDSYVQNYTTNLTRSSLDISRPLWDLHILPIRTSESPAVAILRIHHSLGDGISFMSLLHASTRRISDPDCLPSLPQITHRHTCAVTRSRLLMFFIYLWNTVVEVLVFVSTFVFLKDTKTPMKGMEGVEYRPKIFVHRTFCLDEINVIKKAVGCTINDVMVGIISAALTCYLSRRCGGVLPKRLRITASMAVNIRAVSGIHNLADMMKKDSEVKWGNRIGCFLVRLPVTKLEDPLDYIRKGAQIIEKKKKSWVAIFTYAFFSLILDCLGIKAATTIYHKIIFNSTLFFSNIVGPIEEIGFCGSPLVYIAPSVYGLPQALIIHVQSYLKKIKVVLAVDEHAIPDPHKLLDDIADSLQVIKEAAAAISTT